MFISTLEATLRSNKEQYTFQLLIVEDVSKIKCVELSHISQYERNIIFISRFI